MGSYASVQVRCPFFQDDNGKSDIVCEGLIQDSNLILRYKNKDDWKLQMRCFCQGRYTNCEIYRVLIEKEEYE